MKQYLVDAFTSRLCHGNQAAVCVPEAMRVLHGPDRAGPRRPAPEPGLWSVA